MKNRLYLIYCKYTYLAYPLPLQEKSVRIMNIETTKLELMHLLLQTQKESLLAKLKTVFEEEQTDWWNDLSKEEKAEIETGITQADKGEYKTNDAVMKRFNKWR